MDSEATEETAAGCRGQRTAGFSPRDRAKTNTTQPLNQRLWDQTRLAAPHTQDDKAVRVRRMFDHIAPTYERVNFIASAGRDRLWRRETVRRADVRPTDRVLDLACGTGDLAVAFGRANPEVVVGLDFAPEMLARCLGRTKARSGWIQGDALRLPFADQTFDITSCAFGVRNFQDLQAGLGEMYRVLKAGGRAMILEFSMPANPVLRGIYHFYFAKIMPILATWISRDKTGAYRYLPSSVVTFVTPRQMIDTLREIGFESASTTGMTFGIVNIYRADRANGDTAE